MKRNLAKTYDPKTFEDRIYKEWEEAGAFRAEVRKDKKPCRARNREHHNKLDCLVSKPEKFISVLIRIIRQSRKKHGCCGCYHHYDHAVYFCCGSIDSNRLVAFYKAKHCRVQNSVDTDCRDNRKKSKNK